MPSERVGVIFARIVPVAPVARPTVAVKQRSDVRYRPVVQVRRSGPDCVERWGNVATRRSCSRQLTVERTAHPLVEAVPSAVGRGERVLGICANDLEGND